MPWFESAAGSLRWTEGAGHAELTVERPGRTTTVRFDVDGRRARVGLALAPRTRSVDVSLQPGLVELLAGRLGAGAACQAGRWLGGFTAARLRWSPAEATLTARVGGAAFPLLAAAYDRGAGAIAEVPRWAAGALREAHVRAAARAAFGDRIATRRVARALAPSLLPTGGDGAPVRLYPLAVARLAATVADPDRVAALLELDGPHRSPDAWPGVDTMHAIAGLAPGLGADATVGLLTDAVRLDDGPALLADLARLLPPVRRHLSPPFPRRLPELLERCRNLFPPDPSPRPAPAPVEHRAPARPPEPEPVRLPAAAMRAPAATAVPAARTAAIPYSERIRAVDGAVPGPVLRLALPRTPAELTDWGRRLRNCLGSFGDAAVAGHSTLVGVLQRDVLVGCVELTPAGVVRQFLLAGNRPVPHVVAQPVWAHLREAGVVDPDHTGNAPWREALERSPAGAR